MSTFDESQVRRGQPGNAGKFRDREHSAPEGGLATSTSENDGEVENAAPEWFGRLTSEDIEELAAAS